MMSSTLPWISRTILAYATTKSLLVSIVLSVCVAGILFGLLGARWQEVANGMPVFDQLRTVSASELAGMLDGYTPAMKTAYHPLNIIDLVFPVVTCVVMLIGLAMIMKLNIDDDVNQWLLHKGIFWLLLAMPFVDWVENISFLILLSTYPQSINGLIEFVCYAKTTKAVLMVMGLSSMVLIAIYNGYRRFSPRG